MTNSNSENRPPSNRNQREKVDGSKEEETPGASTVKERTKKESKKRDRSDRSEKRDRNGKRDRNEKRDKSRHDNSEKRQRRYSSVDKENANSRPSTSADAGAFGNLAIVSHYLERTPSPQFRGLPPTVQVSPRSRVHGEVLRPGNGCWLDLANRGARIVDKSLAIKQIMDSGYMVKLGLAPRRSGKSTFVSMLSEFLAAESTVTKERRRELFEPYDLYKQEECFFNKHFAKYAVFFMSFKVRKHGYMFFMTIYVFVYIGVAN
ncbi:hypothetical protein IWW38_000417 [Coemansia aciculifera]|uniref:Uncharacterized protein n=1 Tax=Coemansia aciculifera TaxID=417176 RepID=A0ACC1MB13_9FUNG|nr:hypothetical protein IWW38_000417 [Coemansia aciculifera]